MYIDKILPFLKEGEFVKSYRKSVYISDIFIPLTVDESSTESNLQVMSNSSLISNKEIKIIKVNPIGLYVVDEDDKVSIDVLNGIYGKDISAIVTEIDYSTVARRITVDNGCARLFTSNGYDVVDGVVTDLFVNYAANRVKVEADSMDRSISIVIDDKEVVGINSLVDKSEYTKLEESAATDRVRAAMAAGNGKLNVQSENKDYVYRWLDNYFALPEGQEMKSGAREVVPLLIGPTGVFKSATIKELCAKYDYRMVDFRVAFTSRLDYSGLYNFKEVDGETYSFSCPMEELVTCSDGFREYCKKAYSKLQDILSRGYIVSSKVSNGNEVVENTELLTDEQKENIQKMCESYKNYMRTPVLLLDEITRCKDSGVEGVLVTLLNQKRFNSMTMYGCKFVAATNMNLTNGNMRHDNLMFELDDMYDVNTDLDTAYSNRFLPLKVNPSDVADRWYEWADGEKVRDGVTCKNIHPTILDFLRSPEGYGSDGESLLYNETPVLDAIESGKTDEEKKAQSFPNYRTWEMTSDYLYSIEKDKVFKRDIIGGLISTWGADKLCEYLSNNGYTEFNTDSIVDNMSDFIESTLDAGVPAMIIGPSSMGKSSKVKAYAKKIGKKTGKEPVIININLAQSDAVDILGMPVTKSIDNYVTRGEASGKGMRGINEELKGVMKEIKENNPEMGLASHLTVRAPDSGYKDSFERAVKENRYIILFFDECNRCKNPTVMSAMFEAISDQRLFGISFKHMKDRVKIIGACNMSHSEASGVTGEVGEYANAGSLDPALAARFSMFWKKNYDAKDVKSFIEYMQCEVDEGNADAIVLDFFKSLSDEEAIRVMASVEKRAIENAEPSTRMLHSLAMDIKAMRGSNGVRGGSSLYKGRVLFTDLVKKQTIVLHESIDSYKDRSISILDLSERVVGFSDSILANAMTWEPAVTNYKMKSNGIDIYATDLIEVLREDIKNLKELKNKPVTLESEKDMSELVDIIVQEITTIQDIDERVSLGREDIFKSYLGEDASRLFTPYFNEVFGSDIDVNITIDMLNDVDLIQPFMNKFYAGISGKSSDEMVVSVMKLINDFWEVHTDTLPAQNYAKVLSIVKSILPSGDSMAEIIDRSGDVEDNFFAKAEGEGDVFIEDMLRVYPGTFRREDIHKMRESMKNSTPVKKKRTSKVL